MARGKPVYRDYRKDPIKPDEQDNKDQQKKKPLTKSLAASLAEQRIVEAMDRGEFDNLPGAGRPLDLEDDTNVPEDLKMGFKLLRNNGFAPPWIELQREIKEDEERLRRLQAETTRSWQLLSADERQKAQDSVRKKVKEINSRILSFNLTAPSTTVHMRLLNIDIELQRLEN